MPPGEEDTRRIPSPTQRLLVEVIFELQALRTKQENQHTCLQWPSAEISCVVKNPKWLDCFISACDGRVVDAASLLLAYASWRADTTSASSLMLDQPVPAALARHEPPLVECIEVAGDRRGGHAACSAQGARYPAPFVVAVVRDVRVLSGLLEEYTLLSVVAHQIGELERLLCSSAAARLGGVHLVQDLQHMSSWFAAKMMEPSRMVVQGLAARFLTSAFPLKLRQVIIVDAPAAFSALWTAVKAMLPSALAESVVFLSRPQAGGKLEEMFGHPVLCDR